MNFPRYERYKDSGVEWLGEVPEHWKIRRIRWLCEIKKRIAGELGHDVLSITQEGIKVKDLESNDGQLSMDYSKYQFVEVGDFAMNHMDLLTGYVDLSLMHGITSPDYRVFSIRDPAISKSKYLLYLFQMGYKNKIFFAYGQGSSQLGRWRLPTEQFKDLPFPLPPTTEQQSIASFLDRETAKIDELIAEQQRLIELLKEKRQAVISHAVTRGLNPDVQMKDSGVEWLGEVPEHWVVKKLKFLLRNNGLVRGPFGGDLKKEIFADSGIKVYEQKNAIYRNYLLGDSYISDAKFSEMSRFVVCVGDYIMSCSGTVGRVFRIPEGAPVGIINQALLIIRFNDSITSCYSDWIFDADFFQTQILDNSQGGAMKNLVGMDIFTSIKLTVPSIEEQFSIATFLSKETAKIDELIAEAQQATELLKERRTALISAAVTGKIDVRGVAA